MKEIRFVSYTLFREAWKTAAAFAQGYASRISLDPKESDRCGEWIKRLQRAALERAFERPSWPRAAGQDELRHRGSVLNAFPDDRGAWGDPGDASEAGRVEIEWTVVFVKPPAGLDQDDDRVAGHGFAPVLMAPGKVVQAREIRRRRAGAPDNLGVLREVVKLLREALA